jgi:anti-anti-sigma factor
MTQGPPAARGSWAADPGWYVGRLVAVGVVYYVAALLSLRVALVGNVVTPIWPPTGVAVVALLAYGFDVWPAVTLAAFAVNAPIHGALVGSTLIAAGNTLGPIVGVAFLRASGFRRELDRLRDALALVLLGALAAMTVSATFGTGALLVSGTISRGALGSSWSVWWAGDATGVLVFAPFLLTLGKVTELRSWQWAEAVAAIAALSGVGYVVFRTQTPYVYLVFPLLIWAAVRFGQLGASVSSLIVVMMAVWAAIDKAGPFAHTTLLRRMLTLQAYDAVAALTALVLAAIISERTQAIAEAKRVLQREQRITETLQRSLLPNRIPQIPGVAVAWRYLPGAAGLDVGGDWYDVFVLPDGRIGLTVGDVVGRGPGAAASMGQLRTAVRAYALDTRSPATVVDRLSRLVRGFEEAQMATLIYGVLDPIAGTLTFESAGHPPPLLINPDGTARYLNEAHSPPLGVTVGSSTDIVVPIGPGATLVFYTDGLVEPRNSSIQAGMESLRVAVEGYTGDLDSLCDQRILSPPRPESPQDDVAVLAIRLAEPADRLELVLPAEPQHISSVRRAIGNWAATLGATRDEVYDLVLAADEAASNTIQHAYGPSNGQLEIEASCTGQRVHLVIRDRGAWRPTRHDGFGRGLQVMQALVDEVDVVVTPAGTEVHLRHQIGRSGPRSAKAPDPPDPRANRSEDEVAIVCLAGDIDMATSQLHYHDLVGAVRQDQLGLVIDLSDAGHVDSAGFRMLYRVAECLAPRRLLLEIVVPAQSSIRYALAVVGFDARVPIAATLSEALADMKAKSADPAFGDL